jgi:hypothetical protein
MLVRVGHRFWHGFVMLHSSLVHCESPVRPSRSGWRRRGECGLLRSSMISQSWLSRAHRPRRCLFLDPLGRVGTIRPHQGFLTEARATLRPGQRAPRRRRVHRKSVSSSCHSRHSTGSTFNGVLARALIQPVSGSPAAWKEQIVPADCVVDPDLEVAQWRCGRDGFPLG